MVYLIVYKVLTRVNLFDLLPPESTLLCIVCNFVVFELELLLLILDVGIHLDKTPAPIKKRFKISNGSQFSENQR